MRLSACLKGVKFQSTLPCGSDKVRRKADAQQENFNPRSLAGATIVGELLLFTACISIHAPLRERPFKQRGRLQKRQHISIHAPLRERL